jgi:hypothetical protein
MGPTPRPTQEEIGEAENFLPASGIVGWLAIMDGTRYGSPPPTLHTQPTQLQQAAFSLLRLDPARVQ